MDKIIVCELSELVTPPNTDSISGRKFGEDYANSIKLIEKVDEGNVFIFNVDDTYVKAINDSFIKGLFSEVFKKYKTVLEVRKHITITGKDFFKNLFEKNWQILEEIVNV